jgi:hypothetical protein
MQGVQSREAIRTILRRIVPASPRSSGSITRRASPFLCGRPPASIAIGPGGARFALPKPVRRAIVGLETAGIRRMSVETQETLKG